MPGAMCWTPLGLATLRLGPAFATQAAFVLLVLLVGGIVLSKVGMRAMLVIGTVLLALTSFAFTSLEGYLVFLLLFAVRGTGLALLDLSGNTMAMHVERETGRNIMGIVHAGFSVGIVFGSLTAFVVYSLDGSFRLIHLLLGMVALAFAVWGLVGPIPDVEQNSSDQQISLRAFKSPLVRICGISMGLAFGGELLISQFVSVLLRNEIEASEATSVLAVVIYATMMAFGRIINAPLMSRYNAITLLYAQGTVLAIGGVLIAASTSVPMTLVGSLIGGLGVAGVVPTILSYAARNAGNSAGDTAGATLLGGYLGALIVPLIAGGLTSIFSIRAGIMLVPVAGLLTVACGLLLANDERENNRPQNQLIPN